MIEKWISRSAYLRWLDALAAWVLVFAVALQLMRNQSVRTVVLTSLTALVLAVIPRPVRVHWRPISGWVGLVVSRSLRPGDRAWFVRHGRADSVLVTARRGGRVSIAIANLGEAESISVHRTRILLIPFDVTGT